MLSQNVAKTTVPSYYHIRTNLPQRKPLNQWEGVYYFSGITRRQRHVVLLQRKREREAALRAFAASRANTLATYAQALAADAAAAAAGKAPGSAASNPQLFEAGLQLARHGMAAEAGECVRRLHARGALTAGHYATLLSALAAERLQECLLRTDAAGDPALVYKLVGESGGGARAAEAYQWHEMALADLATATAAASSAARRGSASDTRAVAAATTQVYNGLMRALLTCGYQHVSAVPNALYDAMGARGVAPTASTYEHVMLALALRGETAEAASVLRFLESRGGGGDALTIGLHNALLLGYREERAYDRCDETWQGLVDRRWPRADARSAELYLRSIVDHSYAPVSAPLQRFGNVHAGEKKKVPAVLAQMDDLGIPRTHLSRELADEVEDALRKFSIYRSRFYEWGRAVKQFDFIEFRRRHGWLYDLHLMKAADASAPPLRDPFETASGSVAPAAAAELPAFFSERQPWERQALEDYLRVGGPVERAGDVRAGDIYDDGSRPLHERSGTWMSEVPETRYDQLYGISNPDVAQIGVRRHLDAEYTNRAEVLRRDAAVTRKALSKGRRLRHRADAARTHRAEGQLPPLPGQ